MHLKAIACEVMAREFHHAAARSRNTVEIEFLTQGLHDNPDVCRREIQSRLEQADNEKFDAVLLGYGLCNNGLAGVRAAGRPVVIPRAHDCITLLLGSRERYAGEFEHHPGTYYFSSGWLEYSGRKGERVEYVQKSGLTARMAYQDLVEKYGQENARFIQETMSAWTVHYTRGAYIRFPFTDHLDHPVQVRAKCEGNGWDYAEMSGDLSLVQALLDGDWTRDRFVVVEPGQAIAPDLVGVGEDRACDIMRAVAT